ncbi:MAG: CHRD domain-containing protein, partial [Chloroflexi bacterium]|nr:CHRD domain-containing protein [Chloroflexota bacterium]
MMDSQWGRSLLSTTTARILAVSLLALVFIVSYEASPSTVSAASWTDCTQALYVAMEGNGGGGQTVYRYDCDGNQIGASWYAFGFEGASGLAIDGSGFLYISDDAPGLWKVDTSGVATTIAANVTFENPNGLALDSAGRLLVADSGNRVLRITLAPDGSASTTEVLAQGFNNPQGVIETASGTVLFTDTTGYIWKVTPTSAVPLVSPATADRFHAAQITPGNQGHIAEDPAGNIYISDFGDRIVRISPDGSVAKDVVNIAGDIPCPSGQSGGTAPGFRGMVFTPDNNNLVVTGYCLDNIYVFSVSELDTAWNNNAPVNVLPAPFTQNSGGVLDGNINGPFGIAFFADTAEKPHIKSCVLPNEAPTWWVDGSFTGATSTGSSSQPFKTIMDAVNNVATGTESIIRVKSGTYAEHVNVQKARVHLRGDSAGSTIVDSGAAGANGFTYGADGITIGSFRIVNGGTLNSGIGAFGPSTPIDVEICNNVFVGNAKAVGIANSSPLIVNNTFFNNTIGVSMAAGASSTIIRNNIFQGGATTTSGTGIDALSGATPTIDYNLFFNLSNNFSGGGSPSCSVGCIFSQDPQLADPVGGDFHLDSGSPAIDRGNSIGAPIDDYESDARPIDGDGNGSMIHDMGADEAKSGKGTIKGKKFEDKNDNGVNDGEPGLSDWTIYLDSNNNGVLDSGEAMTTTDSQGNYRFSGVPPGTTTVREMAQSGWRQTYPTNYRAVLTEGSETTPTGSNGTGIAGLEYDESTGKLMFNVSWMNLEGGTTTGLHIHTGAPGVDGSVKYDLVSLAGASSADFASPIEGMVTLDSTSTADLIAGNLYVNLHTTNFSGGEIRGQIASTSRAWTFNVQADVVHSGIDFGNTQDKGEDNCSCIIGIFESDNTHDWELMWIGTTTSATVSTALKVAAVSVNSSESGTIIVKIKDEGSST